MKKDPRTVKVFISRDIPEIALTSLQQNGFDVKAWPHEHPMPQSELIAEAKKVNALLCTVSGKIDKTFLNECSHLEIISQFGAGYDNIDVAEATRLKIPVGNTPNVTSAATADVAFALMITASRKMFYLHKTIAKGEWGYFKPKANLGFELTGKTLGIFGMGKIGMEMAKRCQGAYDMPILYHNRKRNPEAEEKFGAKYVSLDELLQQSDVLSVHCILSEETKGFFNKSLFSKMKPSAIFLNTSRGLVHNEEDLIEALRNKQIWGAGLDVTNPEPMRADNPLLSMENVSILPHVGSGTVETRSNMSRLAALNIIEYYTKGVIPNLVNPESLS
jgi:glyoxylate reductase